MAEPSHGDTLGQRRPPSIEAFKHSMQSLEVGISEKLKSLTASNPSGLLCTKCTIVGERLQSTIENFKTNPNPGNAASRNSTANVFLGTLSEILTQEDCALCCLMSKQFLRSKRREIYQKITSAKPPSQVEEMAMVDIGMMAYPAEDDSEDWIQELCSTFVQISLDSLAVDGALSVWWPDPVTDEVNDEPVQIPMVAEDYRVVFGETKPWVLLPKVAGHRGRDIAMYDQCFKACKSKHKSCNEMKPSILPARLIDIKDMNIFRLNTSCTIPYLALSYVWGTARFLLLKQSNEFNLGQPGSLTMEDLPKTISDAIDVTRTLGYRYLWVDALCIIQDDKSDKAREIAAMHSIYAGADLTIVAATGDDANSGLLAMDSLWLDEESHPIASHRFALDRRETREVVEFSTWFSRGWTFQELVFSNRTLYFTPERTYFCCGLDNWSEDCPFDESISPDVYNDYLRDDDPKHGFGFSSQFDPFDNYASMVEKISRRDFTDEADILDACEGFWAGILEVDFGSSMCRLPASCFEFALAWHPDGNIRRRGNSTVTLDQFPSWSWAGWVGPSIYPFSGPQNQQLIRTVEWTFYELSFEFHNSCHQVHDMTSIQPILPLRLVRPATKHCTQWPILPSHFGKRYLRTRAGTLKIWNNESHELPRVSFASNGLLFFKTKSIRCSISETTAPDYAKRRNLRFFSIDHERSMIGELKIDSVGLENLGPLDSLGFIELISLFEMDFGNKTMESFFWLDSRSRHGIFSREFSDMIQDQEEKNMHIVMWIRWDGDVAYRVAIGYATVEGFQDAGPAEKEIILG